MQRRRLATVVVAAALVGGPAAAQDSDLSPRVPSITVEGQALREVAPDMAVITLGITTDKPSAQDASTQTARVAAALLGEVKADGVADHDVQTTQATITPVYDQGRSDGGAPRIAGFRAATLLQIKVHRLDQAGDLASRLIDKGANDLQGIDFIVSDPEPVLDDLRADATRDAARRAAIYAKAAGVHLGRILEIRPDSIGAAQPTLQRMKIGAVLAASQAPMPLQSGTRTLEAHVGVTWALQATAP